MGTQRKTTVFLVDDHEVVIEGIKRIMEGNANFEIIGHAANGLEAIKQVKSLKPNIVIMDIAMPNFNGIEATYEILVKSGLDVKIIIYSMISDMEPLISLFKAGISGYVLKDEPIEDLIRALETVEKGHTYHFRTFDHMIRNHIRSLELGGATHVIEPEDSIANLSFREKEVFILLADGESIKEIADTLCISPKTVESHKYNIMEKLNVSSLADLTKIAIKKKLIQV